MNSVISKSKMLHMHGVAEYMYNNALSYGLDPEEMYILGLLHDIGYIRGRVNHGDIGGTIMSDLGYQDAVYLIWHDVEPAEYLKQHDYPTVIPSALVLLWEADCRVDAKGNLVSFDERVEDVRERYGEDSDAFKCITNTVQWLNGNMINYKSDCLKEGGNFE